MTKLRHSTGLSSLSAVFCCLFVLVSLEPLLAQQPLTLADVEEGLPEITNDEPIADSFSALKAAEYLDRSALNWQKTKSCATCHTNLFYMAARPALGNVLSDSGEVHLLTMRAI